MDQDQSTILAESLAPLSVSGTSTPTSNPNPNRDSSKPSRKRQPGKGKEKEKFGEVKSSSNQAQRDQQPKRNQPAARLRGQDRDSPEVRISKTLSWLLRHGAQGEGLKIRTDGYIRVDDILQNPKLKAQNLTLDMIKEIVKLDSKQRYDLIKENAEGMKVAMDLNATSSDAVDGVWWIKARQGHSIKTVQLELKPITSIEDIPSKIAVHGTNLQAWSSIRTQGLSKMKRNHIHLAQGVAGESVISGMRTSSQILIFINLQKALDAGIKFFFSDNGVILTEGDGEGFLRPEFFERVENAKREVVSR
ncbi:hypothetical protein BYT27DRAFT_7085488 [Phlegmacium glaucopus]|nr:hypothetical protein BYT27DRAFT_7085488 [Phlegmacium glaucopus]